MGWLFKDKEPEPAACSGSAPVEDENPASYVLPNNVSILIEVVVLLTFGGGGVELHNVH